MTPVIMALAGCYLVLPCATMPAAAQSSSDGLGGGWVTHIRPGPTPSEPAKSKADQPAVKAKKKATNTSSANSTSQPKDTSNGDLFRPGAQYGAGYDAAANIDIYGSKTLVDPPRPPVEIGRPQYTSGAYEESSTIFGELNPLLPGLAIYGDWRTAVAYNGNNGKDIAQIATRLNLDVDLKITGTERLHAFFTPLQKNNQFTRFEFGGGDGDGKFTGEFDFRPATLFFEGDLGSIQSGFTGSAASYDLPFTVGLFPLFLQNGIWANDAILGGAATIPARNSRALGLPNFDVTFFAATDNIDNAGLLGVDRQRANLYGVTSFVDAFGGYIESGYGLIQGKDEQAGLLTHFVTSSYSRRYFNTISNSTRVFANFGNAETFTGKSDEGVAIISENSLITGLPSTLIPYANFFVGVGSPQPLVDGNGAGILKNVGINFETDALTGYPKLDDTASGTFGGAIGLQYLFNLDQQIVFELATVQPFTEDGIGTRRPQYGVGVRYQIPIDRAWLFRADATYQIVEGGDEDNFGVRAEVRRKF